MKWIRRGQIDADGNGCQFSVGRSADAYFPFALLILTLVALLLRFYAASDNFWLDEIFEYSDRILVFSGGRVAKALNAQETSVTQLGELIGGKGL